MNEWLMRTCGAAKAGMMYRDFRPLKLGIISDLWPVRKYRLGVRDLEGQA
jgi:hypothetical protein